MTDTLIGPLETRVLEALWARGCPSRVRDLQPAFPSVAYTTLMTTMDRLHRKGLLERQKSGRAFVYVPRQSREAFRTARAGRPLTSLLDEGQAGALLSFFVDAVSDRDEALLDELERLIRDKRRGQL